MVWDAKHRIAKIACKYFGVNSQKKKPVIPVVTSYTVFVHSQKANAPSTQLRTFGKPTWIYTVWTYLYHNAFTNPNEFILSLQYCNYWYKWINCSQHHFLPPWLHCSKMNLYSCFRNSLRTLFYRINSIFKQYSLK